VSIKHLISPEPGAVIIDSSRPTKFHPFFSSSELCQIKSEQGKITLDKISEVISMMLNFYVVISYSKWLKWDSYALLNTHCFLGMGPELSIIITSGSGPY
jgi:hypothetical protein